MDDIGMEAADMQVTALGVNGPYPAVGGACSGYLVEQNDTRVLLDAGTGVLARLQERLNLSDLSAVVLSHLHFDHMSDMLPLQYALAFSGRKTPLPVIAPDQPGAQRVLLDCPVFELMEPHDRQLGALSISFEPARHPVPAFMVSICGGGRRLAYTGDTNLHPALDEFASNADLLLADAGLLTCDWNERSPHLSAALCGQLAARAGAKRLLLTHLSPRYDSRRVLEEAQRSFPAAELAQSGQTYRL